MSHHDNINHQDPMQRPQTNQTPLSSEGESRRYFMIGTGSLGAGLILGFGLTPQTSLAEIN